MGPFGGGAWLTLKPIGIRLVGTVVRRLVQDCAAAVGENEKQGWRFEIHGAIVERRVVGVGGSHGNRLLPSGGSLRECPDVAVRRNPAGSVSAEPGIMLIPWMSLGGNCLRQDGPRKSLSSHWRTRSNVSR